MLTVTSGYLFSQDRNPSIEGVWQISRLRINNRIKTYPASNFTVDLNRDNIADISVTSYKVFFSFSNGTFKEIVRFDGPVRFINGFKGDGLSAAGYQKSWIRRTASYSYSGGTLNVRGLNLKVKDEGNGTIVFTDSKNKGIAQMSKSSTSAVSGARTPPWTGSSSTSSSSAGKSAPASSSQQSSSGSLSADDPWSDSDWK